MFHFTRTYSVDNQASVRTNIIPKMTAKNMMLFITIFRALNIGLILTN